MALSSENTRRVVNLPKKLLSESQKIAIQDDRSWSNYVVNLIRRDVEQRREPVQTSSR